MATSIYSVNKGVNRSIEFKGLKGQYIWYFGAGVLILMFVFTILYVLGLNTFICMGIIGTAGTIMGTKLYSWSKKYGEHGMMKAIAYKRLPKQIKCYGRAVFKFKTQGSWKN